MPDELLSGPPPLQWQRRPIRGTENEVPIVTRDTTTSQAVAPAATAAAPDQLIRPLALRAMFMRPCYLEKSAWLEHIPFAFWLVEVHQPRLFVELGTHYGSSYFAFCQAVEHLGLDTRCFAIDTWKGDEHAGLYGEEVFENVRAHNDAQYSSFSRLVRSTFDEALEYFSNGTIDLLHIDGLHTIEAVKHDFESWLPKLSNRAVVVMHDTNVRERHFGVFKLLEELREAYPSFEFVHGHGLAVIGVGAEQKDELKRLFDVSDDEFSRRAIREVFGRLGRACGDAFAVKESQERLRELRRALEDHKKELDALKGTLDKAKSDVKTRANELGEAQAFLQTQAGQHASERSQLSERITLLQELRGDLKEDLKRLNQRVDQASAELKERTDALFKLQLVTQEHQRLAIEWQKEAGNRKEALHTTREELERRMAALAESQKAAREQKEASDKVTEQQGAKLRVAEAGRDQLKTELAEVRGQLDAARADAEAQKQAVAVTREEAGRQMAALAESQKALRVQKEASDKVAEQQGARVREAETARDELKTELAGVRGQLDAARADAEAQKQAVAVTREEAGRQMAALAESQKALRVQKEASDKAAEQQGARLREAETARDELKTELAGVRGQLDAARADAEVQKQAVAAAREEAERQTAALTASQKALSEEKEATEKAAQQLEVKLREAEAAREHLKTEFTEVRGQLDAARADTEAQKQAAVVAREEAEQHAATLADFKEAADRAAEQHRAKLRETEITCDQLKTELAEVRDQLDAARANAEAQKQASVAASNEAERQMAALTASEKRVREQKEAAEKAAEQQEAKLRGVETARDQLMTELAEIRGQLDAARADVEGEKQAAAAASEEAERRRAALAASEKTLREQKEAAEKAVEQYRRQVEQQGMVLRDAEATRDEMRSESEKLASKLQARFDEIAKLTKLLQAAESVSVARTKELTETQGVQKRLSAEAEARRKQLAEELSKAKAALREQKEAADKVAEQYRQRVEQQGTVLRELESTRDKLKAESHGLASKLQARFDEIAKLTSLLQAVESASVAKTKELAETREVQQRLSAEAEALRKKLAEETIKAKSARQASINQLGQAVMSLLGYSPGKPLKRSELAQFAAKIKEAGVLDSGWYLKKYKDVADAGMDPAVHYLLYGINEGREPSAPSRGASKG